MLVEIYDQREINSETLEIESDEKALALIESLGLTGQTQINSMAENHEPQRNPYTKVTQEQQVVIYNLFPEHCLVRDYNQGAIPLRILEEIEKCKHLFTEIHIAYAPPAGIVDPIVIGVIAGTDYYSFQQTPNQNAFVIGRWGDALFSWNELYKEAIASKKKDVTDALKLLAARCERYIKAIDMGIEIDPDKLRGDTVSMNNDPFQDRRGEV